MLASQDNAERVVVTTSYANDSLTLSIDQKGTVADIAIQKTGIGTWVRRCLSERLINPNARILALVRECDAPHRACACVPGLTACEGLLLSPWDHSM